MVDVAIVGGGLAGLLSAIHLQKAGKQVYLFEKQAYPRNKVCGEYISNEVLPYLDFLGLDIHSLNPVNINRFLFSASSGTSVETRLPLGGFSIRRFTLDHYLYEVACKCGVKIQTNQAIQQITFHEDHFQLTDKQGQVYESTIVIGGYGKRSVLDRTLDRPFFKKKIDYVGVKMYYEAPEFPKDLVALHNFPGGYCGLSKVENDWVNAAYLTTADSVKKAGSIDKLESTLVSQNPFLGEFLASHSPMLQERLVISNISFLPKELITDHILMTGDAAGMIPPLAGNGMAMAIHSAKLVSETILTFLSGTISRMEMESSYQRRWNQQFKSRLFWGRQLQKFMGQQAMELAVSAMRIVPKVLPLVVKQTHGSPIRI